MTRADAHSAALAFLAVVAAAIIFGPPTAPLWVRWAGVALALPAILLFVVTSPRSER